MPGSFNVVTFEDKDVSLLETLCALRTRLVENRREELAMAGELWSRVRSGERERHSEPRLRDRNRCLLVKVLC